MRNRNLLDRLPAEAKARLRRIAQPQWVAPMLATLTDQRFSREGWLFEPKWDGERCLAVRRGRELRLFSRNRKRLDRIRRDFPTVVRPSGAMSQAEVEALLGGAPGPFLDTAALAALRDRKRNEFFLESLAYYRVDPEQGPWDPWPGQPPPTVRFVDPLVREDVETLDCSEVVSYCTALNIQRVWAATGAARSRSAKRGRIMAVITSPPDPLSLAGEGERLRCAPPLPSGRGGRGVR